MTDQEVGLFLVGLAIIILVARLLGMAAKRLGQPPVVGEIVAGILLGPTLFHGKITATLFPITLRQPLTALANLGVTDLAAALDVTPSMAGRICDRLLRKGLIRRHRARSDRRAVQVSLTAAGWEVVDQAIARRRALIADILGRLPVRQQSAVASALAAFAAAAGEIPDSQWPTVPPPAPALAVPARMKREPARSGSTRVRS